MNPLPLTVLSSAWRHGFLRAALLASLAATLPASSPARACTLVDLGVDVSPTDISDAGTIVGSRATDTSHEYTEPGNYIVVLTVTDDEGMTGATGDKSPQIQRQALEIAPQ